MEMKLACKDLDPKGDCPFVSNGETMEDLKTDLFKNAKTAHSYTDEQLKDLKILEEFNRLVKKE